MTVAFLCSLASPSILPADVIADRSNFPVCLTNTTAVPINQFQLYSATANSTPNRSTILIIKLPFSIALPLLATNNFAASTYLVIRLTISPVICRFYNFLPPCHTLFTISSSLNPLHLVPLHELALLLRIKPHSKPLGNAVSLLINPLKQPRIFE